MHTDNQSCIVSTLTVVYTHHLFIPETSFLDLPGEKRVNTLDFLKGGIDRPPSQLFRPIFDDRLKGKLLKPWVPTVVTFGCVCLFVCCQRATEHIF